MTTQQEGFDQTAEQKPGRQAPDFTALSQALKTWAPSELEILWQRFDEIKTSADFQYFFYYCKQNALDPAAGEVVPAYRWNVIKRREVLTPIVTIGLLRKRRAPECDGIDQFVYQHDGKALVSASGTIHRKGCAHPFSATVFFDEYAVTDNRGGINYMWTKSHMMLSKVLEAQLTRMGFFDLCGEFLIDEETQRSGDEPADQTKTAAPADEFAVGEKKVADPKPETERKVNGDEPEMKPSEESVAKIESTPQAETKATAEAAKPDPTPAPQASTAEMATFDEMIALVRQKIGGATKSADPLIARYFAEYLDIQVVGGKRTIPKDRGKLMEPLTKLFASIDNNVGTLKADPEALGRELSGRKKSLLDAKFAELEWGPSLQGLARQVIALNAASEDNFLDWISAPIAGDSERGTAVNIVNMHPEALQIFFPIYLLARGRTFEVIDWAIAHGQDILKTFQDMVTAAGIPLQKWDAKLAIKIIEAVAKVSQQEAKAPPTDDDWASGGLPFEEN